MSERMLKFYEKLGIEFLKNQDYEEAIINFKKSLEIDCGSVDSLIGISYAYIELAKYKESHNYYMQLSNLINHNEKLTVTQFDMYNHIKMEIESNFDRIISEDEREKVKELAKQIFEEEPRILDTIIEKQLQGKEKSDYILDRAAKMLIEDEDYYGVIDFIDKRIRTVHKEIYPFLLRIKADSYAKLNQSSEAIELYKEAINSILKYKPNDLSNLARFHSDLSKLFLEMDIKSYSLQYINAAIKIAEQIEKGEYLLYDLYKQLSIIYDRLDDKTQSNLAKEESEKYREIWRNQKVDYDDEDLLPF